jgi:hypothetical protein
VTSLINLTGLNLFTFLNRIGAKVNLVVAGSDQSLAFHIRGLIRAIT